MSETPVTSGPGARVDQQTMTTTVLNCGVADKLPKPGDVGEIVKAVSGLAWPIVVVVLALLFRNQIRGLIDRISRWKGFGQEVELERQLDRLQKGAADAANEPPAVAPVSPSPDEGRSKAHDTEANRFIREVIGEAARSPRLGLMLLASELEGLARRIAFNVGQPGRTLTETLRNLSQRLPGAATSTLPLFLDMRNRVVHGSGASDEEILRALDSGIQIYWALQTIPVTPHIVKQANIPLFRDEGANDAVEGATGVMLERQDGDPDGHIRIFPTTRGYFREGMEVSWEWDMANVFSASWYRDRSTGQIRKAFDSAAEFVGRDMTTI